MSTPLPDDVNRWPTDPYRLLGIERGAAPAEVRKAYTRLIRQFKPEQHPEHFRRIRDAYEAITRFGGYPYFPQPGSLPQDLLLPQQPFPEPPLPREPLPPEPLPPDLPPASLPADLDNAAVPLDESNLPRPDITFDFGTAPGSLPEFRAGNDDLVRLWERAVRGEELEAYRGLCALADRPDRAAAACPRLYWLLRAAPELDPARSPCDWLVRGLRGGGWHSVCHELYRREVEHHPREALSERFESLLEAVVPLPQLAEWLRWRWLAAGRLGEARVIIDDIERMRPRFLGTLDDEVWGALLLDAVDQLAWVATREAAQATTRACEEIEQLIHLHSRLDLHRLDILRDLTRSYRADSRDVPKSLLMLARASWTGAPAEMREQIRLAVRELLQRPEDGLAVLDDLRSRAPLVFAQFAGLIDRAVWETAWEEAYVAPTDLAPFAARFVETELTSAVAPPRQAFLRFCLENVIVPAEALDLMTSLPDQVRQDEVLRVLCVAYRWFWG